METVFCLQVYFRKQNTGSLFIPIFLRSRTMRTFLFILFASLSLTCFGAKKQKVTTDSEGWYLAKLDGWNIRYEEAKAKAKELNKPLFVVFAGSDWSKTSQHMLSGILSSKEFETAAKDKAVFLLIEYFLETQIPEAQAKHNREIRDLLMPPPVYPCTVITAPDGKTIRGIIEGEPSESAYLEQINKLLK